MGKRKVVLSTEPGSTSKTTVAKRRTRRKKESLPKDSTKSVPEEKPSVTDLLGSLDEETEATQSPSIPPPEAVYGVAQGPGEYAGIAWVTSRFVKNVAGKPPELLREELKTELIGVHQFVTTPAIVKRGYDFRRNLGNFTTAQVTVGVYLPCYVEDLDHCDEFAQQWCESRMVREHNEMDAVAPGNSARQEPTPEF